MQLKSKKPKKNLTWIHTLPIKKQECTLAGIAQLTSDKTRKNISWHRAVSFDKLKLKTNKKLNKYKPLPHKILA